MSDFGLSRRVHARAVPRGPLVLVYHAISQDARRPAWPWAVAARDFERQLDFLLASGYQTHRMDALAAADASAWPRRHIVISFDDGYRDNLWAVEALHRRGMTGTWFVLAGNLGMPPRWPGHDGPSAPLLDAAELRAISAAGFEIGSHGLHHRRLTTLAPEDLARELTASRHALEEVLGQGVTSFAYPYGDHDQTVVDATRQAGYGTACTTQSGWALRDGDPFRIRRLTIGHRDSLGTFVRKLAWATNDGRWGPHLTARLRRLVAR